MATITCLYKLLEDNTKLKLIFIDKDRIMTKKELAKFIDGLYKIQVEMVDTDTTTGEE